MYAKLVIEERKTKMVVCVFCEGVYQEGTMVCPVCNDYKGLMPIKEAVKEYNFLEYLAEEA